MEEKMKKLRLITCVFCLLLITGCSSPTTIEEKSKKPLKVGILLSDTGLGDESFNDSAFRGLEKARDELGILFDYREAPKGNSDSKLEELVKEKNDLIIGLGFSAQEALEKKAKKYPKQQFLFIDGTSDLENITSITFKENEGSFLVGMVAAMKSKDGKLGFIGGMDVPLIHHFLDGYTQGAKYVNPKSQVTVDYANTFGDATIGNKIATKQLKSGIDFIYPAAGYTGVGAIQAAESTGKLAAGVDSDQYYVAEKAVVTSMLKNIDVAVYSRVKEYAKNGKLSKRSYELGLKEKGISLSPVRVTPLTSEEEKQLNDAKDKIISGAITINDGSE
jgi:basic membrane protein A